MQASNSGRRNYRRHFDFKAFFSAVDAEREARKMTWKAVADESEVSPSSLTRLSQGKTMDVDGLASVAAWAGVDLDDFFVAEKQDPRSSDSMNKVTALVRADQSLSERDANYLESLIRASYQHMRDRQTNGD